jgi:hypothetical protein
MEMNSKKRKSEFIAPFHLTPERLSRVFPDWHQPREVYSIAMQTKNVQPSKLLVRHVSRNRFLGPAGRWVKRAEAAFNFPNPLNAINTCLGSGLENVELILRFEGRTPDCRVPLHALQ